MDSTVVSVPPRRVIAVMTESMPTSASGCRPGEVWVEPYDTELATMSRFFSMFMLSSV